jgi:hypothetical protein
LGFQELVALFPHTYGMRFDARQILKVFYSKGIHFNIYNQ